jgi:hypothetical protein
LQASGQYVHEVLVDFRMPNCLFLEYRAPDEAQLAIYHCEHRRRSRLSIDDGEFADDRARTENGKDTLIAPSRSYDDLEQAFLESIAAVAGLSGDKKRFIGIEVTRYGICE